MAKIPPSDPLRNLVGVGALTDLSRAIETVRSVEGSIFPKTTNLKHLVAPLDDEVLRRVSGANFIGSQLRETLEKTNATILGRGIGSSAALSAARIHPTDYGLKFGSLRIAELYGAQSGVGKLFRGWKFSLEGFGSGLDRFVQEQQRLDERTNDFVQAHGWPVPLSLPVGAYRRLVGMADAGKREVSRLMTRSFRPGTRVFGSTREVLLQSPQLASRRPLVKQSLSAYKRRDWYLVINGLLPLVEGVLVDFAYQSAPAPKRGRTRKALKELREKENATLGVAVDTLETMLHSAGANVALFEGFDQADYGRPGEPRSLNRNAILHGASRRYGSEQNALRLLLLVAVMAEAFDLSDSIS
ncbi:MAG TPA: hypothetical protein VKB23_05500 [Solirubrobacterales bacterium]|nr:hypothetical protein [Solirubrobacterales bacterium]